MYIILYIRDLNLMVKYMTFNHQNMGSSPIDLKIYVKKKKEFKIF